MKGTSNLVEQLLANESLQHLVMGTASEEETQYWESWRATEPGHEEAYNEAVDIISSLQFTAGQGPTMEETDEAWMEIMNRVESKQAPSPLRVVRFTTPWRVAASFALLILAGAFLMQTQTGVLDFLFVKTYKTGYAERLTIHLVDGSQVVLNASSTLTSPRWARSGADFNVKLEGEAFFEVAKRGGDTPRQFSVETDHGLVSVLGTIFNLSCRDAMTRVTLNEGSLRVTKSTEGDAEAYTMLTPGYSAEFGEKMDSIRVAEVNPMLHSSWTTPLLWFEKTPLQEVISMLTHTYGYEVRVEDQDLMDYKVSGTIENKQQVLLEGLATLIDRSIIFEEGVVIIQ